MSHQTQKKNFIEVLSIAFMLALSITFMVIFNLAITGGGSVVVEVNNYGEMVAEMLLLNFIVLPTISVGLYYWHQRT